VKYELDAETNTRFTRAFLEKYMALGFGNLPKKEIDILIFSLLNRLNYLEGKNAYEIAGELRIDESRLRRLLLDAAARDGKDTLRDSIDRLKRAVFDDETIRPEFSGGAITLLIEDPVVKRDFVYALRLAGYSYDQNLNPERIEIPVYAFTAVLCKYDDLLYERLQQKIRAERQRSAELQKAYKDAAPLLDKIKVYLAASAAPVTTLSALKTLLF